MKTFLKTPIGALQITSDETGEYLLSIQKVNSLPKNIKQNQKLPVLMQASQQLKEYFKGKRRHFNLPLNNQGTLFQKQVWEELQKIPYGDTLSYVKVAQQIKRPKAQRAVGSACNKNPFLIIVPCHRILKKNESLGGFALGTKAKKWLLEHEQTF